MLKRRNVIVEEEIGGEGVTDCNAENLPGPRFESGSKDAQGCPSETIMIGHFLSFRREIRGKAGCR